MKFTPFILFLILIFVLIISIVFSRFFPLWKGSSNQEGMIDFAQELEPMKFTNVSAVPQYATSRQLLKVYDSIFYDTYNSNVIIVDGILKGCTVVEGSTLAKIETITVIPPDGTGNYKIYNKSASDSAESKYTFSSKNGSWSYLTTTDSKNNNNDKYYIFYIAKDRERFIHIIKTPNISVQPIVIENVRSFYHNKNGEVKEYQDYTTNTNKTKINISTSSITSSSNDRTFLKLPEYDNSNNVYQLKNNVFFDVRNGNLIVKDTKIKIYDRSGNVVSNSIIATTVPSANAFSSWMVNDTIEKDEKSRGNIILYMANGQNTVIVIFTLNNQTISIDNNIYKFNSSGIDTGTSSSVSTVTTNVNSDINKWLAYWTVVAGGNSYSDDYLLKTQIVPPVCPTCPSCPNSGTCTNCGGQGGSGTLSGSGTSVAGSGDGTGPKNLTVSAGGSSGYATTANPDTLGGATTIQTMELTKGLENIAGTGANVIERTVDTAGNIVEKTGSGAVGLLKDTGSGASNLITSGASGAAGLLRDTVSGAVDLAKDTVSGAIDLAKDAGSGVTNILSGGGNYRQSGGYGSGSGSGQSAGYGRGSDQYQGAIDPYSYNGALVSKPSDFIPVTADFSAFGK